MVQSSQFKDPRQMGWPAVLSRADGIQANEGGTEPWPTGEGLRRGLVTSGWPGRLCSDTSPANAGRVLTASGVRATQNCILSSITNGTGVIPQFTLYRLCPSWCTATFCHSGRALSLPSRLCFRWQHPAFPLFFGLSGISHLACSCN